jgi:hypothetical protein
MKRISLVFAFVVSASAGASDKFVPGADNRLEKKDIITVSVNWIKDKGKKFDLNLTVQNDNPQTGMILFLSDLGCQRGEIRGTLKHTFFNTGERTIDFKPKETKSFNLVCSMEAKAKGHFKIVVNRVYDNPSLDGKTVGKVIAEGLTWSQDDRVN